MAGSSDDTGGVASPLSRRESPARSNPESDRGGHLDNLTHSLVGAAIGRAGADRTTPLATATLIVAANAPDIDVASFVHGEYFALAFRRGITHGWPALLVLPFVVTAVMLAWDRWVRRRRDPSARPARAGALLGLSALGLATHPSLDWLNTYGMRWGLPFDGAWTYGDALFIIDPWVWLILGGAVLLASDPGGRGLAGWGVLAVLTSALVVAGIGGWPAAVWVAGLLAIALARARAGAPDRGGRPRLARFALIGTTAYIGLMVTADGYARTHVLDAARGAGLAPQDVMVAPLRGTPLRSAVQVVTPDGFVPGRHAWLEDPRVVLQPEATLPAFSAVGVDAATATRLLEVAGRRESVRNYLVWSRFPYVRVEPEGAGWGVFYGDARYHSEPGAAGLAGLRVLVSPSEFR